MGPVPRLPPVQLHGVEVVAPAAVDQAVPRPAHRHVQHGPAHVSAEPQLEVIEAQYSSASCVHLASRDSVCARCVLWWFSLFLPLVREYSRITQSCPAVTNMSSRGPQWSPQNTWANIFSNRKYF